MIDQADDLDRFLADNPAMSVRDWKGKGFHAFAPFDKYHTLTGERPWHEWDQAEVRRLATREKARFLPRSVRMAAARDPGLIWDERTREYRLRDEATLAPQATTGDAGQREGAQNVGGATASRPAASLIANNNLGSRPGTPPARAPARVRAREGDHQ